MATGGFSLRVVKLVYLSKALPDNKGKVSCSEDYRRDFSCECDFNNAPKVVDWMSELEAFTAGKELAECTLMYCISLGQGNSKEMRIYGGILRILLKELVATAQNQI